MDCRWPVVWPVGICLFITGASWLQEVRWTCLQHRSSRRRHYFRLVVGFHHTHCQSHLVQNIGWLGTFGEPEFLSTHFYHCESPPLPCGLLWDGVGLQAVPKGAGLQDKAYQREPKIDDRVCGKPGLRLPPSPQMLRVRAVGD